MARVVQRQHAPSGANVGLKTAPVEFLSKKLKISYSRNRPMQAKQSKKQKHTKNPTQKVHQARKTRYKRQGETKTPSRSVCKPNRRSTEVALIYSANAKQKRFEGYLAVLQAPSKVYKSNNKLDPQRSRQFVEEVNPLCGQRRSLLAQQGSSNKQTMS